MHDQNYNADLLELALVSLRQKSRYKDSIVVFTNFKRKFKDEDSLNITRVVVDEHVTKDPRNFRIYMNQFYDFSQHKKIIYLDFDILVLKNVNRAFSHIRGDEIYYTYAPVFPWTDNAFMTKGYIESYRNSNAVKGSTTGICSGVFGIRTKNLDGLLSLWRKTLEATPSDNDQHALNELIIKDTIQASPYPNEWIAYPFQVKQDSDDNRIFTGNKDFIFYHFNPTNNQTKLQMMTEYLEK
jgi:hypothetical protein